MRKSPYVSRLLPLHQPFSFSFPFHQPFLPFSTDDEAAASKGMVIYAFSAQITLFTSFFLKQPLRNTVFLLFLCKVRMRTADADGGRRMRTADVQKKKENN